MIIGKTHITSEDLSKRWGLHLNTIQRWRTQGGGPKFIRLGLKRILYPIAEVEAYESRTVVSTSDKGAAKYGPCVARRKAKPR